MALVRMTSPHAKGNNHTVDHNTIFDTTADNFELFDDLGKPRRRTGMAETPEILSY